jgi:hypothetical protein
MTVKTSAKIGAQECLTLGIAEYIIVVTLYLLCMYSPHNGILRRKRRGIQPQGIESAKL